MTPDDHAQRPRWLNRTTVGTVAGVIVALGVIAAITVGRDACEGKEFPVICLATMLFR